MRRGDIYVSAITVWEITRKATLGKLPTAWGPYPSLTVLPRAQGFRVVPLGFEEAWQANALPDFHRDPVDRVPIATASRHNDAVLTDDAAFPPYGFTTLW